jgi:molecular chaperone DnaK
MHLAAQTGQNNADLLLRRKLAPGDAADLLYNLLSRFLHRPGFLSHLRSFNGYGGPEILPSSTRPLCLICADAGHSHIDDRRLDQARERLRQAASLSPDESDAENAGEARKNIREARKLLALARKEHLRPIRQLELNKVVEFFERVIKEHGRPAEVSSFQNLENTARRAIDNNSHDFESHLEELRGRNFAILWRQDWFVIDRFKWLAGARHLFPTANEHAQLVEVGEHALKSDDIDELRGVVAQMDSLRIGSGGDDEILAAANIVRG